MSDNVDLDHVRGLVRKLNTALGLNEKPAPVTVERVDYEASTDPAKPGAWQTDLYSDGTTRRTFLPSASRGLIPQDKLKGEIE